MCLLTALLALNVSAFAAGGALDGKSFSGMVGDKGEKKGEKDKLVFKDGQFHSTACDEYGFRPGAYSVKTQDGATAFEADVANGEGAKMHWSGTIKGDAVTATAVWTKEGEASMEKWFEGKAAGPAKKAKKQK